MTTVSLLSLSATANPWAHVDGSAGAPVGTPQYPTLLNTYPSSASPNARTLWPSNGTQPPWKVAGVDYYVGCDTTVSLQSPTTLNGAFGGTVSVSSFTVTVSSNIPTNSTIQNIDFGVNDGSSNAYLLSVNNGGSNGLIIKNCQFAVGTNANDMLHLDNVGTQITNCKFNGNGIVTSFNKGAAIYGIGSANNFTAQYCWFLNIAGDTTDYGQNDTIKYCLYDNPGDWHVTDPHADWLQLTDGTYNIVMQFNTVRSLSGNPPSGQGFGFYSQTAGTFTINSVDFQYNTVCTTGTQPKYVYAIAINTGTNVLSNPGGAGSLTGTANISNNFIDPTGAFASVGQKVLIADTSAGSILPGAVFNYINNTNMVNGAILTSSQ